MWAGYLGTEAGERLKRVLGEGARFLTGPGYGVGVQKTGGEPATLTVGENGQVRAAIGDEIEYGCSVTVDTAGKTALLQRDRFGLHAVYTARRGAHLWFASNLRALVRCLDTV